MMNGNGEEKWNNTPQLIWIRHDCILKTYTYFVQIYLHDPFGSYPVPMSHEIWSGQEVATQATAVTATATASRFGQNEVRNAQWQNESLWTAGVKLGSAWIILDPYSINFYQTKPHVLVWRFQSWLSPHDGSAGGWCPDGSCREPSWVVSIIDTDTNLKTTSTEPLENAICPWNCSFWVSILVFRRVSKWFGWREWFHDRGR